MVETICHIFRFSQSYLSLCGKLFTTGQRLLCHMIRHNISGMLEWTTAALFTSAMSSLVVFSGPWVSSFMPRWSTAFILQQS